MTKDLTTGKIMSILVNFTVPLVLGNLFQLTYNAVDSIIVGHFVGKEALAAVGICNPISTLIFQYLKSFGRQCIAFVFLNYQCSPEYIRRSVFCHCTKGRKQWMRHFNSA